MHNLIFDIHIKKKLPNHYDLILVDGPNSRRYGRAGFYHYLNLFKLDVPIIFDDIHRRKERLLIKKISKRIGKKYKVLSDGETGVIL